MHIILRILTLSTLFFTQNRLFASLKEYPGIDPDRIMGKEVPSIDGTGTIFSKKYTPRELHHYASSNQGVSVIAVVPRKDLSSVLVSSLITYEPTAYLDTEKAHYFASYQDGQSLNINFHDVTHTIAPLINESLIPPSALGSALLNGDQQALYDAQFIQPIQMPISYLLPINIKEIIANIEQRVFSNFSEHFYQITQNAFHAGIQQGQRLITTNTDQSKSIKQNIEDTKIINPIISALDTQTEKFEEVTTNTIPRELDVDSKEMKRAAKKERVRVEKIEKRKRKIIEYATQKAEIVLKDGIKKAIEELTQKKQKCELSCPEKSAEQSEKQIAQETTKKKKCKKKKKKLEASQSSEIEEEDEQLFNTILSDEELIKVMPIIDAYSTITYPKNGAIKINQEVLKKYFYSTSCFFDSAQKSTHPFIINFLNTTVSQALNCHVSLLHPDNPLVEFVFAAGILYTLNLLHRLEREKETLSYENISIALRRMLQHVYLRNILNYYKEEYSDLLEQRIKTKFDKNKKLIIKKSDLFDTQEQYIEKHEKEIGIIAIKYVPHVIKNIITYSISDLKKIPRGLQKEYATQSNQLDECIETTIILINYIKKIDAHNGSLLEEQLKKILDEENILSLLNDDEDYPYIQKILNIKIDPEHLNTERIHSFLTSKYYERKKKRTFIYETLEHLKDGTYGDPIELLKDVKTQLPIYALLELPEMKCSKLTIYKEFKKRYPGSLEAIIIGSKDILTRYHQIHGII